MKNLDKGGRPADLVRNYLIYQLAEAAPEVIGKAATVATTGRFVELCLLFSKPAACQRRASKRLSPLW